MATNVDDLIQQFESEFQWWTTIILSMLTAYSILIL